MRILDRGIAALGAALVLGGVGLALRKAPAPTAIRAEQAGPQRGPSNGTSAHVFVLESARGVDDNGDPIAIAQSDVVDLEVTAAGKIGARRVVGTIPRSPRGAVRGVVDGAGTVFVIANEEDRDYGASLFRVEGGRVVKLTEGALRGSRPLVANGVAYAELGAEGVAGEGEVRVDDLQVVAFDSSGAKSVLYAGRAFALHLAGTDADGDLLVYDVRPEGAAIVTVSRQGRVLRRDSVEPFARDFTRDGARLVFANHAPATADHDTPWTVEALDLVHHTQTVIHEERAFQPAPFAFGGATWFTASSSENGKESRIFHGQRPAPLATGDFAAMEAIDGAGAHALVRRAGGGEETLVFLDVASGIETPLDDERSTASPIGFVGGEVVR